MLLRLPLEAGNGAGLKKGQALVYATSWWNEDTVNEYLQDKRLPIWASLSAARTELYRDVQALYHGSSPFLERCCPNSTCVAMLGSVQMCQQDSEVQQPSQYALHSIKARQPKDV